MATFSVVHKLVCSHPKQVAVSKVPFSMGQSCAWEVTAASTSPLEEQESHWAAPYLGDLHPHLFWLTNSWLQLGGVVALAL